MRKKLLVGVLGIGVLLSSCVPTIKPEKITELSEDVKLAYNSQETQKVIADTKESFGYKVNTSMFIPYLLTVGFAQETVKAFGGPLASISVNTITQSVGDTLIQKNGFGYKVLYEDNSLKTKNCKFFPVVWTRNGFLRYNLKKAFFANIQTGKYFPTLPLIPFNNYGVKFTDKREETNNRFIVFIFDGTLGKFYDAYASITFIGRVDIDGKPARMFLMTGACNGAQWEEVRHQISYVCEKEDK